MKTQEISLNCFAGMRLDFIHARNTRFAPVGENEPARMKGFISKKYK